MFWMSKRKQRDLDRERTSERNRAYIEGYSAGYKNGKSDGLTMRITPNQIRFAFGLPEIDTAEREEKQMKVYKCDRCGQFFEPIK